LPVVVAIKTKPSEVLDRSFTTAAVIQTSEQEA